MTFEMTANDANRCLTPLKLLCAGVQLKIATLQNLLYECCDEYIVYMTTYCTALLFKMQEKKYLPKAGNEPGENASKAITRNNFDENNTKYVY